MPTEAWNIIWSVVGIVATGLVSWATTALVAWLNTKIKNEKAAKWAADLTSIVSNAVLSVTQTFVDTMKKEGKFDEAAAKEAKDKALAIITGQLTPELKDYITSNFGDMAEYLGNLVEATVQSLKCK